MPESMIRAERSRRSAIEQNRSLAARCGRSGGDEDAGWFRGCLARLHQLRRELSRRERAVVVSTVGEHHRRARYGFGERVLSMGRHDIVGVGDDDSCRHVDLVHPTAESNRPSSRPAAMICGQSCRATSSSPHHRRPRRRCQPASAPSADWVIGRIGIVDASAEAPFTMLNSSRSRGRPRNVQPVAHRTSPSTRWRWRCHSSCARSRTCSARPHLARVEIFRRGALRRPWHGYEYDLKTGECAADRRLRL